MATRSPAPSRVVYYPAGAAHLSAEDAATVLAKIGRHDAVWQALMQLLQERLARATVDAAEGEAHAAGRLQEILGLQQQLSALRFQDDKGAKSR